jgi:hypothetical protein
LGQNTNFGTDISYVIDEKFYSIDKNKRTIKSMDEYLQP